MIYITDEDYAIAEANGISRATLYARVYSYGKPVEKAILEAPPGKEPERQQWKKIAIENGISTRLYNERIHEGWTYERAATEKLHTTQQALEKASNALLKVFTREQLQTAEKNGIKYQTALSRVRHYGWDADDAVTAKVGSRNPKKKRRRA